MSKQNYVGQYLINTVRQGDWCTQDVGECIWQDSKNLLCVHYSSCTAGREFHSIHLIPVRLAKKTKWYATFDEFYEDISAYPKEPLENTMAWKRRGELLSITMLQELLLDYPWGEHFSFAGNCVARMTRFFKEYPAAGTLVVEHIATKATRHDAREAVIEAIERMITDAGLSADEMARLGRLTVIEACGDEIPF
jgi:hypothetical protein